MANEISYSITLTYANTPFNIQALTISAADNASIVNQPGPFERNVFTATTTPTAIPMGLVSSPGMALLHNTDSVNSLSIYANASDPTPLLTLLPGEWQVVRFAAAAVPAVAASAGTAALEYTVISA